MCIQKSSEEPSGNPLQKTQRNPLEKPSETGGHTDWVQGWEASIIHRSSQVFTRVHRSSQVFTGLHRFSQAFTGSQVSQVFTGLHRFFTGFHRFSQVFTGFHRRPQVFTALHSQVFTGFKGHSKILKTQRQPFKIQRRA